MSESVEGPVSVRTGPSFYRSGQAQSWLLRLCERLAYILVMADPARRRATYQDVLRAPENKVAEVIDHELYLSPRPGSRHAHAASSLGIKLGAPFMFGGGGPGGWIILDEPELHLGREPAILVPDLAGWRRERMQLAEEVAYFTIAPDWVCEVLSPSTGRLDRAQKLPLYGAEGVRHAWLVDPSQRTLEVYRNESGRWLLLATHAEATRVRAEPFEAVELELGALWTDAPAREG